MQNFYKKQRRENCFKPFSAIFLAFAILCILQISMISAFNFDNVKKFDKEVGEYGKYEIRNSILGIPFLELDKVIEIELKENSEICIGYECYAEKEMILYEKGVLIDDIRFLNVDEDYYQNIDYQIYINKNDHWKEYELGEKVSRGTYQVRLEGELPDMWTTIDWIVHSNGYWLDDWATWTSGLNVDILAYWNMTNTTDTLIPDLSGNGYDATIINDGTGIGVHEIPGVMGTAQYAINWSTGVGGAGNHINVTGTNPDFSNLNTSFSTNMWFNSSDAFPPGIQTAILSLGGNGGFETSVLLNNFSIIQASAANLEPVHSANITNNSWHMLTTVVTSNGSIQMWVDGKNNVNITSTLPRAFEGTKHLVIGSTSQIYRTGNFSIDEVGIWNRTLDEAEINQLYNAGSGLPYASNDAETYLISPEDNNETLSSSTMFSGNVSSEDGYVQNATLYVWASDGTETTNQTILSETTNNYTANLSLGLDIGSYTWNIYGCTNGSGIICAWADDNFTIERRTFIENSQFFNAYSYEGANETFSINVTTSGASPSGILYYNGTEYSVTSTGSNPYIVNSTFEIPVGTELGNKSFYWNFTSLGKTSSSTTYEQNISETVFTICNSTYTHSYFNISALDETNSSQIPDLTIPLFDVSYYLSSPAQMKNYSFTNTTGYGNFSFCFSPVDKNVTIDYDIQYEDFNNDYPQRSFSNVSYLTNNSIEQIFYLLKTSAGQYVTFQVINSADQVIEGASVSITRLISGATVTIGNGETGADGGITFWLNPNFEHTITVNKTGYEVYTTSLFPTQTSYSVILGGTESGDTDDYFRGIDYTILPIGTLNNDTSYSFEFNLTSSYWDIDSFGFDLRLKNGSVVGTQSSSLVNFPATFSYDTNNQSIIFMDYYWVIEGNYSNATKFWVITTTGDTEWSIGNFFTDFNTYLDSGFFGIDDFGKSLIIFLVIFILIGIMSYKYGLTSPLAVTMMIFSVIFFLDVVVGIIPEFESSGIIGIEHVLTYISGLILTLVIFKEVIRK